MSKLPSAKKNKIKKSKATATETQPPSTKNIKVWFIRMEKKEK